jgi:hypothetical protein
LSDDHVKRLEKVSLISLDYPHDFFHRFPDVPTEIMAWTIASGGRSVAMSSGSISGADERVFQRLSVAISERMAQQADLPATHRVFRRHSH